MRETGRGSLLGGAWAYCSLAAPSLPCSLLLTRPLSGSLSRALLVLPAPCLSCVCGTGFLSGGQTTGKVYTPCRVPSSGFSKKELDPTQ